MSDIDSLLNEAGERWRASQPPPPPVDHAVLVVRKPAPRLEPSLITGLTAAAAVVILAVLVAVAPALWRGFGGQAPPANPAATDPIPGPTSPPQSCAVTRPEPRFVAPSPYPSSAPARYGSEWFGSARLWTMLDREGEVWPASALPAGPHGLSQKTFWWSADWSSTEEPQPALSVSARRLDGSGMVLVDFATNAAADFGTAMLIGVELPGPGCWELTGRYRDAALSYVVWITDD